MVQTIFQYDDDNTCFQQGIFKQGHLSYSKPISEINIIPNPANDKAEIILNGIFEGICKIVLRDALGRIVVQQQFDCKENKHIISLKKYSSGVYSVLVTVNNNEFIKTAKLIITR